MFTRNIRNRRRANRQHAAIFDKSWILLPNIWYAHPCFHLLCCLPAQHSTSYSMRLVPICLSENQNILALLILRHNWTCIYLHEFSRHSTSEQPTYTIIIDKTKTQNNNNNNSKFKFVCVKNLLPYLDKKIRFFSLLTAWNWCSWISSFFRVLTRTSRYSFHLQGWSWQFFFYWLNMQLFHYMFSAFKWRMCFNADHAFYL